MGNCEGNTYNIGMGCCQPVLGPIENFYNKWQTERYVSGYTYSKEEIDKKTSGGTSSGCCITPEEVDEKIASAATQIESEIPSLDGYATEEWVNEQGFLTEHQSLSGYATEAYVSAYTYDKQTIDDKVAQGGTFDPTLYYNKVEVDSIVQSAVTEVEGEMPTVPTSNTAFTNDAQYATSGYVDSVVSGKLDTSVFQTYSGSVESEMGNKQDASGMTAYTQNTAFTAHTSDATIHVTSNDKSAWNNKASVSAVTEADWSVISGGTLDNNTIYLIY